MLEFMDGFDAYSAQSDVLAKWDSNSTLDPNAVVLVGKGRFNGGNCFLLHWFGTSLHKTLTSQKTRVVGAAVYPTFGDDHVFLAFTDAGTTQLDLRISASGLLYVTQNGNELARSTQALAQKTWVYIEMKATIDSAAGAFTVRVGGQPWLTKSGVNTQTTANGSSQAIGFLGYGNDDVWLDDVYVLNSTGTTNNDFLGDCKVLGILPSADGSNLAWTPLSGTTHFSQVTSSDGDTSYVSTATAGAIDTYKFPAQALNGAILAVQTALSQRKSDTGARVTSSEYRSAAGTNYDGANQFSLTASYSTGLQVYETDPGTGAQWTNAGLNGGEFGVKCVS